MQSRLASAGLDTCQEIAQHPGTLTQPEAFALKATVSTRTLRAPVQRVALRETAVGVGRHVGLTGEGYEQRTTWIHVSPEGAWEGHQSGAFELDASTFAECIRALRACETPPPVDYDHASLRPLDGAPTPAAGYILDLEARDDGLWALAEFTNRAAEMVRGGEYRFCSGVFMWDAADRKTGEPIPCQLDSIGLTNKPFIDGQHAIRLSRVALGASMDIKKEDLLAKIEALAPGDSLTLAELKALVEFLEASTGEAEAEGAEMDAEGMDASRELADAAALAEPMIPQVEAEVVEDATPAIDADAASMLLTKLAEMTGYDSASILAALEANADQIKSAFMGADGGAAMLTREAQATVIAELTREVKRHREAEAKRHDAELTAEVDALIACGKAVPGQREPFIKLARADSKSFRALTATLPVVVPMGQDAPKTSPTTNAIGPAVVDKTHPRFAELRKNYEGSAFSKLIKGSDRAARIDELVINTIRREQPIGG